MARKPMPKVTAADFGSLSVTYDCKGKTYTAKPSIEVEGGCSPWCGSHDPDGGYCYCPSVEATAVVYCDCGDIHKFDITYR